MDFLSASQLADRWQKSVDFIYQNQDRLGIPRLQVGREFRYPVAGIEDWENSQLAASTGKDGRRPIAKLPSTTGSVLSKVWNEVAWQMQTERRSGFSFSAEQPSDGGSLRVTGLSAKGTVSLKLIATKLDQSSLEILGFRYVTSRSVWIRDVEIESLANLMFSALGTLGLIGTGVRYELGKSALDVQAVLSGGAGFAINQRLLFTVDG